MANVKNIDKGPRGLWIGSKEKGTLRPVMIEPGQTMTDLDMSADEVKSAKESGWFEIDGKLSDAAAKTKENVEADKPVDNDGVKVEKVYTDDEIGSLRETAKGLGVKFTQKTSGADLEAKIAAKQAA